jgi:ABC-type uncharacterized transport system permease subunit
VLNVYVSDSLFLLTATAYFAAAGLFLAHLLGSQRVPARLPIPLLAVGAMLHAAHIVVSSLVLHVCPVEGIHFPMSVVSMLMCVVYLVMRSRYRIDIVGAFVAPLALTSLLASRFVGGGTAVVDQAPRFKSALLPLHVTANLLGVALFSLAFAAAALYLVQERLLKEKRIEGLFRRLPPLDALDRAEHRFLLAGFPLLTIGILIGTLWARQVEMGGAADLLRAGFGYLTWLLIAGVLLLRAAAGWRGRRAAYGTIAGFGFAVLVLILYLLRASSPAAATAMVGP